MNGAPDLAEFAGRVLALRGALVERAAGGGIEAVLPLEAAAEAGAEYLRLRFDPAAGEAAGELVALGAPALERLGALLGAAGLFDSARATVGYVKKSGLDEAARRALRFPGPAELLGAAEQDVAYLVFNFRYSTVSDERRDGLCRVCLNSVTGAGLPDLEERMAAELVPAGPAPPGAGSLPELPRERLVERACRLARARTAADLAGFFRGMERRLERDLKRVEEYFDAVRRAAERRGRADPEKLAARRRTLETERGVKRRDLAGKYTTKVALALVSVRRLLVPGAVMDWRFLRGRKERRLRLVWNGLLKVVEPPACEACGGNAPAPELDERLRMLCAGCAGGAAGDR